MMGRYFAYRVHPLSVGKFAFRLATASTNSLCACPHLKHAPDVSPRHEANARTHLLVCPSIDDAKP